MDVGMRSAQWLGEVVDLMREPTGTVPVPALLTLLRQAFDVTSCSWNWFDGDGSFGMVIDPAEVPENEPEMLELWRSGELFDSHAVLQWIRRTGDLRPQSIARVPAGIVPPRRRLALERAFAGMGMEHQLSVHYRADGPVQRAFVVGRASRDFSDADLELAGVVQRSLAALDRQAAVVQRMTGARTGTDLGLTGRELAVLQLIAEGLTTRRTANALACSPRTVEKHLEKAFRRLGVRDRLNAVRVLQQAGVLGAALVPDHRAVVVPGSYRGQVAVSPGVFAGTGGLRRT
jgi:DNA-binding CsgD family transcriptional regulator